MAKKKKKIVYPVLFMIIITAFFTLSLASINELTSDKINHNEEIKIKKSLLYVFNILPEDKAMIDKIYEDTISTLNKNDRKIFVARIDNKIIGYAFEIQGNALWGVVKGYAAISPDLKRLLGIDFISHSETPGLGGRISEAEYKEQFRNLELVGSREDYIIHRPNPGGNIDGISGATLTSESVRSFLNEDIRNFLRSFGGDMNE